MTTWQDRDKFYAPEARRRFSAKDLLLIAVWSGLFNVLLLVIFAWFSGYLPTPRAALAGLTQGSSTAVALPEVGPTFAARPLRSDFGGGLIPPVDLRAQKQSLPVSTLYPDERVIAEEPVNEASYEPASEESVTAEDTQGLKVSPVLVRGTRPGEIAIGNFKAMTMAADASECEGFAQSMLDDVNAPQALLKILADTDDITVARICAANGAVVLTCRMGGMTISPRRSRPDDGCAATALARAD